MNAPSHGSSKGLGILGFLFSGFFKGVGFRIRVYRV